VHVGARVEQTDPLLLFPLLCHLRNNQNAHKIRQKLKGVNFSNECQISIFQTKQNIVFDND